MVQLSPNQAVAIFPLIMGVLAILLALLDRRLMRFIGLKHRSESFTNPRFKRSSRITENLGRLFLLVIGAGFLVQGVGPLFLPGEVTRVVTTVSMVLSGLIVLVVVGVNLVHWKG
jgi:hypothetical protein